MKLRFSLSKFSEMLQQPRQLAEQSPEKIGNFEQTEYVTREEVEELLHERMEQMTKVLLRNIQPTVEDVVEREISTKLAVFIAISNEISELLRELILLHDSLDSAQLKERIAEIRTEIDKLVSLNDEAIRTEYDIEQMQQKLDALVEELAKAKHEALAIEKSLNDVSRKLDRLLDVVVERAVERATAEVSLRVLRELGVRKSEKDRAD